MEEITLLDGVHVYMNNSISELQLNSTANTDIRIVNLYNYCGQQVKTWSLSKVEPSISLPLHVASGIYIVIVETTAGSINKKIIIN